MTDDTNNPPHDTPEGATEQTRLQVARSRTQREGEVTATPSQTRYTTVSGPGQSSYAGYLFGSAGTYERPAWSDSMQGRAGIRLFSRGVVGAAFFVVGGHIAGKQLAGYHSTSKLEAFSHKNFLQYIARGWDNTAGRALQNVTYHFASGDMEAKARAAWDVTHFRAKIFKMPEGAASHKLDRWGFERSLNGRTLGSEIVTVTFDFFMASIGDAMTRNFVQAVDPNVRQPWWVDKDGKPTTRDKGRFDFGKWAESLGRSSWRILSKNAGEDWAAALPYVYQMKWQRQALARWKPGFKLSSDHQWNGGMARVMMQDDPITGLKKGQVSGGYQIPGLIDLQCRFVGYNWYTLMYRELYDSVGRSIDKMRHGGITLTLPDHFNPLESTVNGAGFLARYVAKSFIKANLYMQPAVPFFWIFRTPQSKYRGGYAAEHLVLDKDGNRGSALLTTKPIKEAEAGTKDAPVFLENIADHIFPRTRYKHGKDVDTLYYGVDGKLTKAELEGATYKHIFNMKHPYEFGGVKRNWVDHLLNPFGWACYKGGSALTHAVDFVTGNRVDGVSRMMHGPQATLLQREKTLRQFVDASFAYTPYMWAKAETALRVDDRRSVEELGQMDKAIYRLIDNTFAFKFAAAGSAAKGIFKLGTTMEREVKSREGVNTDAQPVGDGTVVPRSADKPGPATTIRKETIAHHGLVRHDAVSMDQAAGAHASQQQRQWAEGLAGRKLGAQYQQPSQTTLH